MRVNAEIMLSKKKLGKTQARAKGIMKNYYALVKIEWSNFGIEAYNTHEAVERLKEIFLEQHNIELADQEIIKIELDELKGK